MISRNIIFAQRRGAPWSALIIESKTLPPA